MEWQLPSIAQYLQGFVLSEHSPALPQSSILGPALPSPSQALCVLSWNPKCPFRSLGKPWGMCRAEQQEHEATHIIFQSFLQRTTVFSVPIELNYILSGPRSCLDAFEQLGAFTDDALDTVTAG